MNFDLNFSPPGEDEDQPVAKKMINLKEKKMINLEEKQVNLVNSSFKVNRISVNLKFR